MRGSDHIGPGGSITRYEGERERRRNRRTGFDVVLVDTANGGDWIDGDYRWQLLCDEHSSLLDCHTLAFARSMMAVPDQWCENCREKVEGPDPGLHTYVHPPQESDRDQTR